MSRAATSRLKVNPPLDCMPALQYAPPAMLRVDHDYQRTIEASPSQALIRRMAQHWNWDLCLPLVVSRRAGDPALYVIDGQHRLEAAKLRGDIQQLPCVVVEYVNKADEAASFVHLNQQRRPLSRMDLFKAAVASEDAESIAITAAIAEAGLSLASHSNYVSWKPGMVAHIGGIQQYWRERGPKVTLEALTVLAQAFDGVILQYAGTLFPGIAAVVQRGQEYDRDKFIVILKKQSQNQWKNALLRFVADRPDTKKREAIVFVMMDAWRGQTVAAAETKAPLAITIPVNQRAWCQQCDRHVGPEFAEACNSRFCSLRRVA